MREDVKSLNIKSGKQIITNISELLKSLYKVTKNEKDIHNMNINLINSVGFASFEKIKDENGNEDINIDKIIYAKSMISRSLLAWLSIIGFLIITGVFI